MQTNVTLTHMPSSGFPGLLSSLLIADRARPAVMGRLRRATVVPASIGETFAFFSEATNLQRLTPSWLDFTILTPSPISMREGLEIDYRIRLYGFPIPWRSRIDVWEPGVRFVDRQVIGPYRWWRHEHRFEAVAGGTRVVDEVTYVPRARWVSGALVRRDVERIFDFRERALVEIFSSSSHGRLSTGARSGS
jgi:ligand-binding SRPBCC domain-containing protein